MISHKAGTDSPLLTSICSARIQSYDGAVKNGWTSIPEVLAIAAVT